MVLDEVQTGNGRTGKYFAHQYCGIKPDIITTAKGVAGGYPVGVTLISEKNAACMGHGDHGSTFGGSPLACAAGVAVIETIIKDKLMENAAKMGKRVIKQADFAEARGLGLMVGIDTSSKEKAQEAMKEMRSRGILINITSERVVRLVPPLTINKEEVDLCMENLEEAIK
jgi:acetylornithine/succinyldiaminopimelate/putrescine aminotransferase